jgi:SAM-dependent methyltransferase
MHTKRIFIALLLTGALGLAALQALAPPQPQRTPDVIYVPTPNEVVAVMLKLAEVDAKDVVYDLGCGDGRLVVTAAKTYGAHGVGIDIDPKRIQESNENAKKEGVTDKVKFMEADLFTSDISQATAVTLYLLSSLNQKLRPKLFAELKPGTPVVSHDFDMGDWEPEQRVNVQGPSRTHTVYRWTIPAKAAGTWEWKNGRAAYKLTIAQRYDRVTPELKRNGKELPVREAKLHGTQLTLQLAPSAGGPKALYGEIKGTEMNVREDDELNGKVAKAHMTAVTPVAALP